MDRTLLVGDVTELQCILAFQKRGYYCSIPFSGSCSYDLVVDINNELFRVQCKSCSEHLDEGVLKMGVSRTTTNTKEVIRRGYSDDEIDFFYTYWNGYDFLIPVTDVNSHSCIYLRISEPQNGVQDTMMIAADYLLDNVVEQYKKIDSIKYYATNRFISINPDTKEEKLWKDSEIEETFTESQMKYIKQAVGKDVTVYGSYWRYVEFPALTKAARE